MNTHPKPHGLVKFVVDHPAWSFAIMTVVATICFFLYGWSLPWLIKLIGNWEPVANDPIGYKGVVWRFVWGVNIFLLGACPYGVVVDICLPEASA